MLICPEKKYIFFKPLKCGGSSVEHALYQMTGDDALCAGGNEYENKNNHAFHDGEWYDRFHQHSWPEVFY